MIILKKVFCINLSKNLPKFSEIYFTTGITLPAFNEKAMNIKPKIRLSAKDKKYVSAITGKDIKKHLPLADFIL